LIPSLTERFRTLAKTPRKWTGARSPSGLKRVRSSARRHEILAPRRSAAKTLVKTAITAATTAVDGMDPQVALTNAFSALDRAAKVGAIHPNAAARRKSRLARNFNSLVGGLTTIAGGAAKTVSRAQAQKAAKARIAAGKADKAKGAQTAAGKARAALTRTSRSESASAAAAGSTNAASATATAAPSGAAKATASKAGATRATATKSPARGAKATQPKAAAKSAAAPKATTARKAAKS
jgi:ribosomal protein S20